MKEIVVYKDVPWFYAEMLNWRVENGFVKAYPKRKLSDAAHKWVLKVFRGWGGGYVRRNGVAYFEAALQAVSSVSTQTATYIKKAYEELQKET